MTDLSVYIYVYAPESVLKVACLLTIWIRIYVFSIPLTTSTDDYVDITHTYCFTCKTVRNAFAATERWPTITSSLFFPSVSASLSPSHPCPSPQYYSPLSSTYPSFFPNLSAIVGFSILLGALSLSFSLLSGLCWPLPRFPPSIYLSSPYASSFTGPMNPPPHCLPLFHLSCTLHLTLSIYSYSSSLPDPSNLTVAHHPLHSLVYWY